MNNTLAEFFNLRRRAEFFVYF